MLADLLVAAVRLWPVFVEAAVMLVVAYLWVDIDPVRIYDFWDAIVHGAFWYQNVLLALFTDRLHYAPQNAGWSYRLGFIIGFLALPFLVKLTVEVIQIWRER